MSELLVEGGARNHEGAHRVRPDEHGNTGRVESGHDALHLELACSRGRLGRTEPAELRPPEELAVVARQQPGHRLALPRIGLQPLARPGDAHQRRDVADPQALGAFDVPGHVVRRYVPPVVGESPQVLHLHARELGQAH